MTDRTVLSVSGEDRIGFLDGLITNTVPEQSGQIVYAALLTPQGKFIADFFVVNDGSRLLVDVASSHAAHLNQRLTMYRLRADVQIEPTDLIVSRGIGTAPEGALADPRDASMGWRHYGHEDVSENVDWIDLQITHTIPETGVELTPDTYILEAGFERLNGVDFKKGCFVGQEIVARMKHKTVLKKGIARVVINGDARAGDEITANGKIVGTLHSVAVEYGLAYLRFDRAEGEMQAGEATLTRADA